jgi:hypothetical protein
MPSPCYCLGSGGHNTRHAGAAHFLIVATIAISQNYAPLEMLLASLLTTLGALFSVLDGDVGQQPLPLIGITSLLPGAGRSLVASLPMAY